jgi:hypothetical protein
VVVHGAGAVVVGRDLQEVMHGARGVAAAQGVDLRVGDRCRALMVGFPGDGLFNERLIGGRPRVIATQPMARQACSVVAYPAVTCSRPAQIGAPKTTLVCPPTCSAAGQLRVGSASDVTPL